MESNLIPHIVRLFSTLFLLASTPFSPSDVTVTDVHDDPVDAHEANTPHLRSNEEVLRRVNPSLFCHQYPDKCPVNASLVKRLDCGEFDDLNVTFTFPTIPSSQLDHCTKIPNRGERIKCVNDEVTNHAIKMQLGVVTELSKMPSAWFESYQNYSIMPRLIVKQVQHASVVWRTCMQPNVVQVYQEQIFPVDPENAKATPKQTEDAS